MDGLLDYANIFSMWIQQLSYAWSYLNMPVAKALSLAMSEFFEPLAISLPPIGVPLGFAYQVFCAFINFVTDNVLGPFYGLGNVTLLGFCFSIMGVLFIGFAIFCIWKFLLDIIPTL